MHSSPDSSHSNRDAAALFDEFVRACENGHAPDVEAWCTRAGEAGEALRRRIELFHTLEALGDTCTPELGDHGHADRAADRAHGHASATHEKPPPALVIGRFRDLVPIGRGGLSRVYRAFDPELKRFIALKVISPLTLADRSDREWTLQEGRSLARFDHPGVVRVYDVGEADGFAYIAMEWLDGPTLHDVIEASRAIARGRSESDATAAAHACARKSSTLVARATLFLELARALQYCHERGVLHRDIKPGNVILPRDGGIKLIDFGLAHLASGDKSTTHVTELLMGTRPYIAPEQLEHSRTGADPRSDQFSLCVLAYELLTRVNPFHKQSRTATEDAVLRADPPPLASLDSSIPADLDRIVRHGLERSPGARYASIKDLADDVEAWLDHRAISLAPPTPWRLGMLWARRRQRDLALVASCAALVFVVLCAVWGFRVVRGRDAIWKRVADLEERIPGLAIPESFLIAFDDCDAVERDAHEIDQDLLSAMLGELEPEAHARTVACSLRLSEVLAARRAALGRSNPIQKQEIIRDLMIEWGSVLTLEKAYCRDCTYNVDDRERGRVDVPPVDAGHELRLFTYLPSRAPWLCALERMQTVSVLGAGMYRCQVVRPDGSLAAECDVRAYAEEKRTTWGWHPFEPSLTQRMYCLPATELEFEGAGTVPVAACRILRRPVAWSDLPLAFDARKARVIRARFERIIDRAVRDDEPVSMFVDESREFASLMGARLPTAAEFVAAQRSTDFERPQNLQLVTSELVASAIVGGQIVLIPYEPYEIGAATPEPIRLEPRGTLERGTLGDGKGGYYTFRLAISQFPTP